MPILIESAPALPRANSSPTPLYDQKTASRLGSYLSRKEAKSMTPAIPEQELGAISQYSAVVNNKPNMQDQSSSIANAQLPVIATQNEPNTNLESSKANRKLQINTTPKSEFAPKQVPKPQKNTVAAVPNFETDETHNKSPQPLGTFMQRTASLGGNYSKPMNLGRRERRASSDHYHGSMASNSYVPPNFGMPNQSQSQDGKQFPHMGYYSYYPASAMPTAPICRYFNQNRCWAGIHCRFTHIINNGSYVTIYPTLATANAYSHSPVAQQPPPLPPMVDPITPTQQYKAPTFHSTSPRAKKSFDKIEEEPSSIPETTEEGTSETVHEEEKDANGKTL
ncbi:hypothetical protein HK098_003975, partial [Nowakowskiella sp. JEL0407]